MTGNFVSVSPLFPALPKGSCKCGLQRSCGRGVSEVRIVKSLETNNMERSGEAGRIGIRVRGGIGLGGRKGGEGVVDEVAPEVGILGVDDSILDFRDGVEKELAEVSEDGGVANGETVLGDSGEELAEDVVDVDGGEVFAGGRRGDLPAELLRFEELALGEGMEDAESGVALLAQHAALASVGELEFAEMGMIGVGAFFGHGSSFREVRR